MLHLLLAGCLVDDPAVAVDADGDGIEAASDCDDSDPTVGEATLWFPDSDGDSWGVSSGGQESCAAIEGFSERSGDCNDSAPLTHPEGGETCDGTDEDCDGLVDDDDPDLAAAPQWADDSDGDGYGDPESTWTACLGGPGAVLDATDCDDADPTISPGVLERCDGGKTDEDCDGLIDDADPDLDPDTLTAWSLDSDGDGFGSAAAAATWQCSAPGLDYVSDSTDCDDARGDVNPDVAGDALLRDRDCDGLISTSGSLSLAASRLQGSTNAQFVGAHASIADVDGDGRADLLVGAYGVDDYRGEAYVVLGDSLGGDREIDLDVEADYILGGEGYYQHDGQITRAGDVDGDGLADMLIAAPYASVEVPWTGKVHVLLGASLQSEAAISLGAADRTISGASTLDQLGIQIAGGGDIDGDGLADVLLGSAASRGGTTWLLLGDALSDPGVTLDDAAASVVGDSTSEILQALAFADDLDGDGRSDAVFGLHGGSSGRGAAVIASADLFAGGTLTFSDASTVFTSEALGDELGSALSASGDADGDGLSDILLGAPASDATADEAGKAYLVLGSSPGSAATFSMADADYHFLGEAAEDNAGYSLTLEGDLDGDGYDDLLIGARGLDTVMAGSGAILPDVGGVYLFLGSSLSAGTVRLEDADHLILGETAYDRIGNSAISTSGDVDGDGRDDVLIGAQSNNTMGEGAGAAYLIFSGL